MLFPLAPGPVAGPDSDWESDSEPGGEPEPRPDKSGESALESSLPLALPTCEGLCMLGGRNFADCDWPQTFLLLRPVKGHTIDPALQVSFDASLQVSFESVMPQRRAATSKPTKPNPGAKATSIKSTGNKAHTSKAAKNKAQLEESFVKRARKDYPDNNWDKTGRDNYSALQKIHTSKNPRTKLSDYHLFLLTKWFPDQRKRVAAKERKDQRSGAIGDAAEKEIAAERARSRVMKRKEQRREDFRRNGLAGGHDSCGDSDEVYERRGAMVDVFNLLHYFYTLSFISCNVYILALFLRYFMRL